MSNHPIFQFLNSLSTMKQAPEEARRQPGPKLPGLTRTSQPRKRREGIRFFSAKAGPNSADIEIGAGRLGARPHCQQVGRRVRWSFFNILVLLHFTPYAISSTSGHAMNASTMAATSSDTPMTTHLLNNVRSHKSHCSPRPQPVGVPQPPGCVTLCRLPCSLCWLALTTCYSSRGSRAARRFRTEMSA